jgi:hypothetical protein
MLPGNRPSFRRFLQPQDIMRSPMADADSSAPPADMDSRQIAELMAEPVRGFPSIIVVGDEAVAGFTPPPPRTDVRGS